MKTRIIGDIHGKLSDYKDIVKDCDNSIQIGDFGVGFYGYYWHEELSKWQTENPGHKFFRGNHDDPARCKTMPGYIRDGLIINGDVMIIGGAWSIDYARRVEGVSWWKDEELSYRELDQMIDLYVQAKPRVMLTHDAPIAVTKEMFIDTGLAMGGREAKQIPNRTNMAFQTMIELHQPERWLYGHWHISMKHVYGRTMFQCIGELDYEDIEL